MPSQMLESFCYQPDILKRMSQHYSYLPEYAEHWKSTHGEKPQPPERITDELIKGLFDSKKAQKGQFYIDQLRLSLFDMKVHTPKTHQDLVEFDTSREWRKLCRELNPIQIDGFDGPDSGIDRNIGFTLWGSVVNEEYAAGYYCYA
jgi:metallopeptidase MepB